MNAAFTLVYIFAATPALMDMNFPHDSLAKTGTETHLDMDTAHGTVLADAIAHRSLSASARAFIACGGTIDQNGYRGNAGRLKDRIRFFAGLPFEGKRIEEKIAFPNGHFRPDLTMESDTGRMA